jgi:hypothetical protein
MRDGYFDLEHKPCTARTHEEPANYRLRTRHHIPNIWVSAKTCYNLTIAPCCRAGSTASCQLKRCRWSAGRTRRIRTNALRSRTVARKSNAPATRMVSQNPRSGPMMLSGKQPDPRRCNDGDNRLLYEVRSTGGVTQKDRGQLHILCGFLRDLSQIHSRAGVLRSWRRFERRPLLILPQLWICR